MANDSMDDDHRNDMEIHEGMLEGSHAVRALFAVVHFCGIFKFNDCDIKLGYQNLHLVFVEYIFSSTKGICQKPV